MIRIFIADDHELVREGLKKIFMAHPDMQVVAEAADLAATLAALPAQPVDVLVLDLGLAEVAGGACVQALTDRYPGLPVLVLSIHPEGHAAVGALRHGAAGYVSKATAAEDVVRAVRKVASGGRYVSPLLAELLAHEVQNPPSPPPHTQLTSREVEVLRLLGAGLPIKQAAARLDLSVSSINTYRARIFRKMQLNSNAALIRYTLEHQLV
jgi:DNA-binding NarL/FixJ family response regulator